MNPALIALQAAVRSAQIVGLYAEFSILHPPTIEPSDTRMAQPTLNSLYGLLEEEKFSVLFKFGGECFEEKILISKVIRKIYRKHLKRTHMQNF